MHLLLNCTKPFTLQVLKISEQVHSSVEGKLNKKQREFYLRQQVHYTLICQRSSKKINIIQKTSLKQLKKNLEKAMVQMARETKMN